jgi:hypothetical protein
MKDQGINSQKLVVLTARNREVLEHRRNGDEDKV